MKAAGKKPAPAPERETPGERYDCYQADVTAVGKDLKEARDTIVNAIVDVRRLYYNASCEQVGEDLCMTEGRLVSVLVALADIDDRLGPIAMGVPPP